MGARHLHGTDGEHVEVQVVLRRIAARSSEKEGQFLILATWGLAPEEATTLYEKRSEIETMFAALKPVFNTPASGATDLE